MSTVFETTKPLITKEKEEEKYPPMIKGSFEILIAQIVTWKLTSPNEPYPNRGKEGGK